VWTGLTCFGKVPIVGSCDGHGNEPPSRVYTGRGPRLWYWKAWATPCVNSVRVKKLEV
jgi:hypothetical protein